MSLSKHDPVGCVRPDALTIVPELPDAFTTAPKLKIAERADESFIPEPSMEIQESRSVGDSAKMLMDSRFLNLRNFNVTEEDYRVRGQF